mgnify:CR=1 FL=1
MDRSQDRQTERSTVQDRSIVGAKEEESLSQDQEIEILAEDESTLSVEDRKEGVTEGNSVDETEKEA